MKVVLNLNLILFLLLVNSCSEYEFDSYEDKIVFSAVMTTENISGQVTKTTHPLSKNTDNQLSNIKIQLFENDIHILNLSTDDKGIFYTPKTFMPSQNKYYHFEIIAEEVPKATTGKQCIPDIVTIDTAYIEKGMYGSKLAIAVFTDPVDKKNNYHYRCYSFSGGENKNSSDYDEFINPYSTFSDLDFNGKKHLEKQSIYSSVSEDTDSVQVQLYNISPEYSNFLISLRDYEGSYTEPLYDKTTAVKSNIKNGFGIFGSVSIYTQTIKETYYDFN